MSDARVERAIQESIKAHKAEIERQILIQLGVSQMMAEPGMTDHSLWSNTSRYKEADRIIGDRRICIRNLIANN